MPKPSRPGNLPAEATSFIGRRHELAEARKRLTDARLVSLVGTGGVGKTRLAIRLATDLARGFRDGAWLVELGEVHDPALVGHATMAALDLRDQAGTEPRNLLLAYLRAKELLLVVDNCEHLLEAAARLVGDLLKAAPAVRVITTSREPLLVAGEHVLPVAPLSLPTGTTAEPLAGLRHNEAVGLFVERATAASGRFELTDANRAAVVDLCRRLDGLPLAIELAAVRTRALSPEQIVDRLRDRFDLLAGAARATLPRHQTLRATLEWSYDLLTPAERTLLARLSVFAGRFTLDDVEAVCCFDDLAPAEGLDLTSSLLDKSLVNKEDGAGAALYRLHETTREYARLKLREQGGEDALEQRCADYYLTQCLRFGAEGRHRLLDWLAWLEPEIDNIRALLRRCVDRADTGLGLGLATGLIWYWVTRATTEGARWFDALLPQGAAPQPWAYFARGFLAVLQGDSATAVPVLGQAVTAARAAEHRDALCQALGMASIAANQAGDRASAQSLLDEARRIAADLDGLGALLMVHQAQALNALHDGEFDLVRSAATEGARLSREAGDLYSLTMMGLNQGFAALRSDDVREAGRRFTEALPIARQLDDRVAQCYLLGGLGSCAAASDELGPAAQLLGAMENLRAELGAFVNPSMAPALASATESVLAALGPTRFAAEFQAGRRLSRQAAVRLALKETTVPTAAVADDHASGALGKREADVARLVAQGLSNKEVGARLFISERTVETHVRNILNKLGFKSRAQIAGWMAAREQGR